MATSSFSELYKLCLQSVNLVQIPAINNSNNSNGSNKNSNNGQDGSSISSSTFKNVFQTNRIVGIYFVSQWSNSCRPFTIGLRNLYDTLNKGNEKQRKNSFSSPAKFRKFFNGQSKSKSRSPPAVEENAFEIIVICVDIDDDSYKQIVSEMHERWWILPFEENKTKTRIARQCRLQSSPTLVLLDATNKKVITYDGKRELFDDPQGINFPWWPPETTTILSGPLLSNDIEGNGTKRLDLEDIEPSVKALLFGANWCPPCRVFTKQLAVTYDTIRSAGINFQIIFCSSDRSEMSFGQYFSQMPWLAIPFGDERIKSLTRKYNVNGIPTLLLLDENNQLITRHGRNSVLADPEAKEFPWYPKALYELSEFTISRLKAEPSLVLFTEGTPEDISFSLSALQTLATKEFNHNFSSNANDENGNTENQSEKCPIIDRLRFFYTGDDPICDQLLEALNLGDAPLPLVAILDVLDGIYYICEQPDVSEVIIGQFIADFRAEKLTSRSLSWAPRLTGPSQMGGIPLGAINAALGIVPSPSQNLNLMQQSVTENSTN